jgi:ADP-heptose:LPS heptosyltransferase
MKRAALVVSGNTGVMHAAAAFGTKQVALHGPTNATLWGPVNKNAVIVKTSCPRCPCLRLGFEYHRNNGGCMELIGTESVKAAAESLLGRV